MIDQIELYTAIIEGAKQSRYGRDNPDSNEPGDLTTFFKNMASAHPAAFMMLLGELLQQEDDSEPPQQATDSLKPGRWQ